MLMLKVELKKTSRQAGEEDGVSVNRYTATGTVCTDSQGTSDQARNEDAASVNEYTGTSRANSLWKRVARAGRKERMRRVFQCASCGDTCAL
jgi:hypothetical protein